MKRTPEIVIHEMPYPSGRKYHREIDLLCTRSGYKIIKAILDDLELKGRVRFLRLRF